MATATNIEATAVNTVGWLSGTSATIVVPVYQRQYRWDIGGCEQLLADVRAVADSDPRHMHFIGSVLSSLAGPSGELVLIDGQQRITTLMLLIAAVHHTVRATDPALAGELDAVLRGPDGRTRLRPHEAWAGVFESVVFDRRPMDGSQRDSRFDDNYAFFRSQISLEEAPRIWRGLQKLEHVAITLGAGANAQQIFASLNSTGEPLRDHELIHNYVLMGLSHREQREIEEEFWLPIERSTGEAIGLFWRHFLTMTTGREIAVTGDHGVYSQFRELFPRLDLTMLRTEGTRWREASESYHRLLDPAAEDDPDVARALRGVEVFGKGMRPLALRAHLEWRRETIDRAALLAALRDVEALLLRRAMAGVPADRLVARLCRAGGVGTPALREAMGRITPSDERVRAAAKYHDLLHPEHVLARLSGEAGADDLVVDHIVPPAPSAAWSGDGVRAWADYEEDAQNSLRALARTLGNLALLEEPLAERVFDASFPRKRDDAYARSRVSTTRALGGLSEWDTAAISRRSDELSERIVAEWPRAAVVLIDDDGLTPILDAIPRRGWPRGWEREFAYTEYHGEHWEVYDIRHLFNRVFKRLWADSRESVLTFSARRGGPVYPSRAWNGQWDELDGGRQLYMGWDSRYMLAAVQGVLEEAGLATEVFVKYSYIGDAMASS